MRSEDWMRKKVVGAADQHERQRRSIVNRLHRADLELDKAELDLTLALTSGPTEDYHSARQRRKDAQQVFDETILELRAFDNKTRESHARA